MRQAQRDRAIGFHNIQEKDVSKVCQRLQCYRSRFFHFLHLQCYINILHSIKRHHSF